MVENAKRVLQSHCRRGRIYTSGTARTATNTKNTTKLSRAERKNTMKKQNEQTTTIDSATIYQKADAIAIRAILTDLTKSGNDMMYRLYYSAVRYAMSNHTDDDGKGGADVIQDTVLYLWNYHGKTLDDYTNDGQTDKDREPITILRGAFRNIGASIKRNRQRQYKQTYIEDYENGHGAIAVPMEWDIDNFADFVKINDIIDSLNLTPNQYHVLNLKMRGKSNVQTATVKGCSEANIRKVLDQIRKKYVDIYGIPANVKQ